MSAPASDRDRRRRSGKSAAAFRTISEVAEDLDVPAHVLRFWETKFPSVKPLKRGGGRRYYRPEDIDLLRGIRELLYGDGYTIKGVQKLLKESGGKLPPRLDTLPDPAPEIDPGQYELDLAPTERAELARVLEELKLLRTRLREACAAGRSA
jgi:DNA-binding transcriptional MerR regulator